MISPKVQLSYRLRDLEEGLHTLTLKAWDVYNNSATAEIQFVVAGSNDIKIERVLKLSQTHLLITPSSGSITTAHLNPLRFRFKCLLLPEKSFGPTIK